MKRSVKLVQFCYDAKKYPQNMHIPKILFFLKTPQKIKIQNLRPQKLTGAYVCIKI